MAAALLITDRLLIRKFTLEDASFILELLNDPDWLTYIGNRNIHNLEDAMNYIVNAPLTSYSKYGFGPYLVALKENNLPIGMSCLIKRDTLKNVDIGYAFLKEYRDKGYALEAVSATQKYAHEHLNTGPLFAITSVENESSMKLLKKLGFRFDKKIILSGETEEVLLFTE
jgi:[ribosomal protein S5]-alanine N-acetyltransferase